jgi:predicted nucleic acid-binding protein
MSRQPFDDEAKAVFSAFGAGKFEPYVTANSFTDIFYIIKRLKRYSVAEIKTVLVKLMKNVNVIPLTGADCSDAFELPMDDFEDAVIAACAHKIGADYIVSRDKKFLKAETAVEAITPLRLLEIINSNMI